MLTEQQKQEILTNKMYATITSREIAEMADKRHDNVLRDIDKIIRDLGWEEQTLMLDPNLRQPTELDTFYNTSYKGPTGRKRRIVVMGERFGMVLWARYSIEYHISIIDELRIRRRTAQLKLVDQEINAELEAHGIKTYEGPIYPCSTEEFNQMLENVGWGKPKREYDPDAYYKNFLRRNEQAKREAEGISSTHYNDFFNTSLQEQRLIEGPKIMQSSKPSPKQSKWITTTAPEKDIAKLFDAKLEKKTCLGGCTLLLKGLSVGRYNEDKTVFTINAHGLKLLKSTKNSKHVITANPKNDISELFGEVLSEKHCRGGFTLWLGEASVGRYNKKRETFTLNAYGQNLLQDK